VKILERNLLKFSCVLFIILGIVTIYLFTAPLSLYFTSNYEIHRPLAEVLTVAHPKLTLLLVLGLGGLEIIVGILNGIMPSFKLKTTVFIVSGSIICTVSALCMILCFQFTELVGFVLSVLYIMAILRKKQDR
jgi:hypothetical protein